MPEDSLTAATPTRPVRHPHQVRPARHAWAPVPTPGPRALASGRA